LLNTNIVYIGWHIIWKIKDYVYEEVIYKLNIYQIF